jgi:hypothetical protein
MGEVASAQINSRLRGGYQVLKQCLRFLIRTRSLQHNLAVCGKSDRHCSISAMSNTSNTRPSPNTVVPAIPGVPDSSPSRGFSMTSIRSPG